MDKVLGVITAFVGLTALAIVVSRRADTARVVKAITDGIASLQRGAISAL